MFKLSRFYGLKIDEILAMTAQETKYYLQAMDRIKAEERLELMDAVQYPHMKDKDRGKRHKEMFKRAYPESFEEKVVNLKDLKLI